MSKFKTLCEKIINEDIPTGAISTSNAFSAVSGEPAEYLGEPSGFSPENGEEKIKPIKVTRRL